MNSVTRFGRNLLRVEDNRLLTGKGRYVGNLPENGAAFLVILRSPYAHAEIKPADTSAAKTMPGVLAVYTGEDLVADGINPMPFLPMFKRTGGADMAAPPRHLLAVGRVRYVGEPVVAIVAETKAAALDAAETVLVDYDGLPPVLDMREAVTPGAPALTPDAPDNIAAETAFGDPEAVEAAFAGAAHVVKISMLNQRLVANAMEPRSLLAVPQEDGRLNIYKACQAPTLTRQFVAGAVLGEDEEKIRVIVGDIGGGFGMKSGVHNEEALACYAARRLNRPVKYISERGEEFSSSVHGRDHVTDAEMAIDADGKILAVKCDTLANMGAYLMPTGAFIPLMLGPKVLPGTYHIPAIQVRVRGVLTNTMPTAAYRGAGRPENIFTIERLMDEAAAALGLDGAEIRRRNLVQPAAMPYKTVMGEVYDSGNFPQMLAGVLEAADWSGFSARQAEAKSRGKLLGHAVTSYIEWTGAYQFTETVDVTVTGEGRVIVNSATQAMGQGLETAYTQLVALKLGVDPSVVTIVQGDTDVVKGPGSYGSRSAYVGGAAVTHGADQWVETAMPLAAEALEASAADLEFGLAAFRIAGTDREIGIFELAEAQPGKMITVKATHTVENSSWPNGAHVAEVEVDPETGVTKIVRYTTTDDVGYAINQMLVEGQIHGGIAQGVGQALMEHCRYDPESGQLITGSFMDYQMPRAEDFCSFNVTLDQSVPCQTNPLGVKGCGESGTVAATPTILNAILNALRPLGVKHLEMPATPLAVWEAIENAKA
jgi:carbon-monoxide dehydrogenase large subunit